jgi:DNA-directed RNA polymerase sigma subunit (sigma70/sigma32)
LIKPADLFSIPLFKKKELQNHFLRLDQYLKVCILLAWKHSKFVETELLNFYMELMSGRARFKNYYVKENTSRVNMKNRMEHGYTTDDKKFLLNNYKIVHSFYTEIHPDKLEFNRLVLHSILEKFFLLSKDYCMACDKIAAGDYSYTKQKKEIEDAVGIKTDYLYGVLKQMYYLYDKFIDRRNVIVKPYFRYVYALATRNSHYSDDQTAENFQAGTFGLMRAILLYNNKSESSTFGNYAKFWIRQAMTDNVYKSFLINIPNCSWTYFNKLEKLRDSTKTVEELADKAQMSVKYVKDVYARILTSQVLNMEASEADALFSYNPYDPDETHFDEELFSLLDEDEKFLFAIMFGKYDLLPQKEINPELIAEEKDRQRGA